jgi:hypothetical protein
MLVYIRILYCQHKVGLYKKCVARPNRHHMGSTCTKSICIIVIFLCQFRILKLVARTGLFRLFNDGSDDTALLPLLLLKIRSVRMLDMIVCSGPLVWLFSPAWDAVKLTLDVGFI